MNVQNYNDLEAMIREFKRNRNISWFEMLRLLIAIVAWIQTAFIGFGNDYDV